MRCVMCDSRSLDKDTLGLNKKLFGKQTNNYYCLDCMADYLDCTREDLLEKIDEFKDDGCTLFD